jgi:hypothetical protein
MPQLLSPIVPCFNVLTDEVKTMNRKFRIEKRRATLRCIPNPIRRSSSAIDAAMYSKNYDLLTHFIVCGICGLEGPVGGSKSISDMQHYIDVSGMKEKFCMLTTDYEYLSKYDRLFIVELLRVFENGIIIGCSHVCGCCCQQLKGKKKSSAFYVDDVVASSDGLPYIEVDQNNTSNDADMVFDDEVCTDHLCLNGDESLNCEAIRQPRQNHVIPKFALFNGLFAGTVPDELVGLTCVEESMINIYSAVTKMFLAGGKHYKMKGGTSYTIVNDLTSVAKFLPRMPSIEDTAIMRHKKTVVGKEYTYRPFRVYSALNWLKKHNHLYDEIEIKWPINVKYWQKTTLPIDIPFIELTDDEDCDINCGDEQEEEISDEYTTNTGMYIFLLMELLDKIVRLTHIFFVAL